MKYESCQEIVKGKDYTRDEPLCDNTTLRPARVPASSRYREQAREEKGGNPQFLLMLNIQTLRIKPPASLYATKIGDLNGGQFMLRKFFI